MVSDSSNPSEPAGTAPTPKPKGTMDAIASRKASPVAKAGIAKPKAIECFSASPGWTGPAGNRFGARWTASFGDGVCEGLFIPGETMCGNQACVSKEGIIYKERAAARRLGIIGCDFDDSQRSCANAAE